MRSSIFIAAAFAAAAQAGALPHNRRDTLAAVIGGGTNELAPPNSVFGAGSTTKPSGSGTTTGTPPKTSGTGGNGGMGNGGNGNGGMGNGGNGGMGNGGKGNGGKGNNGGDSSYDSSSHDSSYNGNSGSSSYDSNSQHGSYGDNDNSYVSTYSPPSYANVKDDCDKSYPIVHKDNKDYYKAYPVDTSYKGDFWSYKSHEHEVPDCNTPYIQKGDGIDCGSGETYQIKWKADNKCKKVHIHTVKGKGGDDCDDVEELCHDYDNSGSYGWKPNPKTYIPNGSVYGFGFRITCADDESIVTYSQPWHAINKPWIQSSCQVCQEVPVTTYVQQVVVTYPAPVAAPAGSSSTSSTSSTSYAPSKDTTGSSGTAATSPSMSAAAPVSSSASAASVPAPAAACLNCTDASGTASAMPAANSTMGFASGASSLKAGVSTLGAVAFLVSFFL